MNEPKRLRIVLRDPAGLPVSDARVMIEAGAEPFPDIAALSDARGEVVMSLPGAGRYRVLCVAEGFEAAHTDVDVEAGGEVEVVVELAREG